MSYLLTGGTGYIGSHCAALLLQSGADVVIVDNLSNSSREALLGIEKISGKKALFYQVDIRDESALRQVFQAHNFAAVFHFAGLKAVGESVLKPHLYYENNVAGSLVLLKLMQEFAVKRFLFSSSATVYSAQEKSPLTEEMQCSVSTNPYGTSKYFVEQILLDTVRANPEFCAIILRYFNPIGAHESALLGENPQDIPNNLLPYLTRVAAGKLPYLSIFGNDYPTPDGTGQRDYLHVMDLVEGHIQAYQALKNENGAHIYNLGTGSAYSVLEIVNTFAEVTGIKIPYQFAPRRAGDLAFYYADSSKAARDLGWRAKRDLKTMLRDAWAWEMKNA